MEVKGVQATLHLDEGTVTLVLGDSDRTRCRMLGTLWQPKTPQPVTPQPKPAPEEPPPGVSQQAVGALEGMLGEVRKRIEEQDMVAEDVPVYQMCHSMIETIRFGLPYDVHEANTVLAIGELYCATYDQQEDSEDGEEPESDVEVSDESFRGN